MAFYLAKYNTQTVFSFPMVKRGVVDLAVSADWTPATGDTKVSKDQGNVANTSNNPAATGGTGSALWNLTLTATELSAAEIVVQIVDSATKAVEDQVLVIYTYGNASAKIVADLSDTVRLGLTALPNVASGSAGAIPTTGTGANQIAVDGAGNAKADVNKWLAGTIPAVAVTGVPKVDLTYLLGTILSEGAGGRLAAAVIKFFDKASPTGTINSLPDAVPDASGGLPVTGTRLTAIPTLPAALVGGRIDASVGAMATGVVTATAIAADAIGASELAADAVTEIQSGLATASALTTAQADLDDIQTRLPAALAADGSIKASVQSFLGTAFTEGAAGRIAAAFKQFFNIATPAATMDHLVLIDTATTATNLTTNNDKTGYALTSAYDLAKTAAQAGDAMALTSGERTTLTAAIWNALTSGLTTVGSIGKLLVDNVNATISSRSSHSAADVWAVATRLLTAGTNIVLAKGTGVTGFNDLDAAGVRSAVGLASANLDTQLAAIDSDVVAVGTAVLGLNDLSQADVRTAVGLGSANLDTQLAEIESDVDDVQTRLPAALVGGRMDSSIGDVQGDAIADAGVAADLDTYQARVDIVDDNSGTTDRYVCAWFKNSQPVLSGVTDPIIQVWKASDGTDLIGATSMTEIGSTQTFRYLATSGERIADGAAYVAKVTATIDGSTREWIQVIGRDSA